MFFFREFQPIAFTLPLEILSVKLIGIHDTITFIYKNKKKCYRRQDLDRVVLI